MRLGFGVGTIDVGFTGGVSDAADGGLLSSTFLSNYGPYGMVMDFTDASISINDETDVLDYSSQGTVSATTGALLGPGSKLTYTAPSLKFTEQADGFIAGQAHNLYLNSATPANQSITVISGATYAITITGSVSITLSGAATGTVTAGTTTFTAASGTLTCGSTSGSGTVHVRRTPSVSTYVATTSAAVYDLPYVFSGGVRTGILVEPAATNLCLRSNDFTNASWTKSNLTAALTATGPDNVANSASTLTATAGNATALQAITSASSSRVTSVYIKRRTGSGNIDLTQDNGSTWTTQTVTSSWTRVSLAAVTSTNPTVGIRIVTSGDEVDVWCLQHETGTVVTSPIITYAAAVTRAADNIAIATTLFPLSTTAETLYSGFTLLSTGITDIAKLKPTSGIAEIFGFYFTPSSIIPIVRNGGSVSFAEGSYLSPVVGAHKYAMAAEVNNARGAVDGTLSIADTTSVTMPGTVNLLTLGSGNGSYGGSSPFLLSVLAYFPERKADATLQTMTTA